MDKAKPFRVGDMVLADGGLSRCVLLSYIDDTAQLIRLTDGVRLERPLAESDFRLVGMKRPVGWQSRL